MAKRKPLEVEEVSEQQVESDAPAQLTLELGLVMVTTLALVIGLVLGWMELQRYTSI